MFHTSVPVFIHGLTTLSTILKKGEVYTSEKKIDPSVFVNARLAPTMFPLSRQIQITCDIVKGGVSRLAGEDAPSFADTETTFLELQTRIDKTITYLKGFKPEQIDGTEAKDITLKVGGHELKFIGQAYLLSFVIPNFYFHITAAYTILRHNGVDVGKMDFLGNIQS